MNTAYLEAIATHGGSLITHIALVNGVGVEVGDARKPVTWTAADDGLIRPDADLIFDMTEGEDVAGWKGFSALTDGVDYDGAPLTPVSFNNNGTYTLRADSTSIDHNVV